MSNYRIETKCIQSGWEPKNGEPRILPIIQSTTFKYESSDEMGALFDLERKDIFIQDYRIRRMIMLRKRFVI